MARPYYALVKWVGGLDNGKYTAGVPTEWIKDFTLKDFISEDYDASESWVIEWRKEKKRPKGGWTCYDGLVIDVCQNMAVLEKRLLILDGENSSDRVINENLPSTKPNNNVTKKSKAAVSKGSAPTNANADIERASKVPEETTAPESLEDPAKKGITMLNILFAIEKLGERLDGLHSMFLNFTEEFNLFKEQASTRTVQHCTDTSKSAVPATMQSKRTIDQESHHKPIMEDSVEIGKPGSGIMVDHLQWTCAASKSTFTAMGISLLMAVFPMDVLLRSNLKGGPSKLQQGDAAVHHDALDSRIIDAIKGAVRSKHPNTYDDAKMGIAINSKLCSLRRAHSSKPLG